MRDIAMLLLSTVALGGCTCAYGGPGCSSPWAVGLCAPVVQVDTPALIEINYGDDTGLHPADVTVERISAPSIVGVWPGDTTGSLSVFGLAAGDADVELDIAGWDDPGVVQFHVGAETVPACDLAPDQQAPVFEIPIVKR